MFNLNIKPLSVNDAWQGKRFKTPLYRRYEKDLFKLLPPLTVPEGELKLTIQVGFSNRQSDLDNITKQFLDIISKKYGFNDNRVYEIHLFKNIVKKGDEYIDFELCNK